MALIRTSVFIGGTRLSDHDFSSIHIKQNIGSHHIFKICLRQDAKSGVLMEKIKSWIGQTVKIGVDYKGDDDLMSGPVADSFKGIVTSIGLSRVGGTSELVVKGQSPSVVLDDGPNTRSFTDKGLQEIVDEVIKPYTGAFPSSPKIEPQNFSGSIPYCVQYKESNFRFLNRLANRYAEWFYYDGLDFYFGKPKGKETISLDFGEGGLKYFNISVKALPAKFAVMGYDYEKHESFTEDSPQKILSNDLGKETFKIAKDQIFSETTMTTVQAATDKDDLKDFVKRYEEINLDDTVLFEGASQNSKLKVGSTIKITDKTIGESYGSFIVTSIVHNIEQGGDYNNSFGAVPVEVETSPLTTIPSPPFCESQLATVTNVSDEESLGRVKVKFLWQEETSEESPWLRVASPYTGKDKGFYIIPEVDDQVLIAFESNNPDKPYVLTGMYNGDAKPEWFDPKNNFKGFKSREQNQWKFDDKEKSILISSPNSITMHADNKIIIETGGKKDSEISINAGEGTINVTAKVVNVKATETIKMESNKELLAKANQTVKIESGKELSASGTQKVDVKGTQVSIEGSATSELKGAKVAVQASAMAEVKGAIVKIN